MPIGPGQRGQRINLRQSRFKSRIFKTQQNVEKKNKSLSAVNNMQLASIAERALPCLSGDSVSYNADKNLFVTSGYTSAAGNHYFKTYRCSDRICITCHIGHADYGTFLNDVIVYGFDGQKNRIIGTWSHCGAVWFSDSAVRQVANGIVKNYLASQTKLSGTTIPDTQLLEFSKALVEETERRQIA